MRLSPTTLIVNSLTNNMPPNKKLIMTPLIFISFLVSLAIVDIRNSALRAHYHADPARSNRLPRWLHRVVYRYQPYRYVVVDEQGRPLGEKASSPGLGQVDGGVESPGEGMGRRGGDGGDYYRSKQKKLMRMEAAEAFEIRSGVMVVMGVLSLGLWWVSWRVASWGLGIAWSLRP